MEAAVALGAGVRAHVVVGDARVLVERLLVAFFGHCGHWNGFSPRCTALRWARITPGREKTLAHWGHVLAAMAANCCELLEGVESSAFDSIRHSPARCLWALPEAAGVLNAPRARTAARRWWPRGADVQVAQLEVRAGGVAQVHPALQREALAAGVGDGVAEPRVAQELRVGEALPGFELHALRARLRHGDEAALGHLAPRAHEAQSRPDPHRLRGVGARHGPPLVAQRHRLRGRQPPVVLLVEAHPVGVADDQAGVRLPAVPGQLQRLAQRRLLRLVHA